MPSLNYIFTTFALYLFHGYCYAPINIVSTAIDFHSNFTVNSTRKPFVKLLLPEIPDTIGNITYDPMLLNALQYQSEYLKKLHKTQLSSGLFKSDLWQTVNSLVDIGPLMNQTMLLEKFDFFQIKTPKKKNRVRLTGYYTPIVQASPLMTPEFSIPLCQNPKFKAKSDTTALELAWVKDKRTLKNAQLQGSCIVQFPDGRQRHLGFGGYIRHFGKIPYVYFQDMGDERVFGATNLPLTPGYSIAVDSRYIPLGACLLAELPHLDASGKLLGHTYRIVFAQDRGGAIKTSSRMDLYCGKGKIALDEAVKINGEGRFWLMLPKKSPIVK
jgi:membrane-bound lytic murein transglycosylase A